MVFIFINLIVLYKKRKIQVVLNYDLYMKKRIKCSICGNYDFPTKDHVPPKSCNNKKDVIRTFIFPTEKGYSKKTIIQGGLNFSYICSNCNNNVLGVHADKELENLFNTILNSSGVNVSWSGNIEKVIKSVFGHILATDDFSPVTYDKEMRDFINKNIVPKHAHLYLLYYPYKNVFIIRDVLPLEHYLRKRSIRRMNDFKMISCLYFYPLAFIVTDEDFYPLAIDLVELLKSGATSFVLNKNSFTNIITGKLLPPCWPCEIGNTNTDDTVDIVASGREGKNAQIAIVKQ